MDACLRPGGLVVCIVLWWWCPPPAPPAPLVPVPLAALKRWSPEEDTQAGGGQSTPLWLLFIWEGVMWGPQWLEMTPPPTHTHSPRGP